MLLTVLTLALSSPIAQDPAPSPEPLPAPTAEDWPQWRGVDRDGVSKATGWNATGADEPSWSVDVGMGYSTPAVVGDLCVVAGFDAEREVDVVRALAVETGALLWSSEYPAQLRAYDHTGGTLASPTIAGDRVYVSNRDGGLRCFDARTGRSLWFKDLLSTYAIEDSYYGYSGSPVVVGDRLFLNMDRMLGFDAITGDLLWKTEPIEANYSTPQPFDRNGALHLAVFGQQGLHVLDAATGTQKSFFKWHKSDRLVNASTPVLVDERIYLSSAYDHGCALLAFDGDELDAVWANRNIRNKMAGCVFVEGHVFGFDESVLKCLDVEDGSVTWKVRGLGNGALVAGDGKLAIMTSNGELIVAAATGEEFRELSRTQVFDDGGVFWAPPVIARGRILCRSSLGALVALDHREDAGAVRAEAYTPRVGSELPASGALFARHLAAIGGADAVRSHAEMRMTGTFEMRSVGFTPVPLEVWRGAPDLWRCKFQAPGGRPGFIERMYDGELGYELNRYLGNRVFEETTQRELGDVLRLDAAAAYDEIYSSHRTLDVTEFGNRPCYRVEATAHSGAVRELFFEVESGLYAGRRGEGEALSIVGDYREFDGLLLPMLERSFVIDTGIEETFRIEAVHFEEIDASVFERPDAITELLNAEIADD